MTRVPRRFFDIFFATSIVFLLSSCATSQGQKWEALKASEEFQSEKRIYEQRMAGIQFCWTIGVDEFLKKTDLKPSQGCIYPASKMQVADEGTVLVRMVLRQAIKQLKVMQVTSDGFLIQRPHSESAVIFVQKTDERGLVDDAYLDESADWRMYEYIGTYQYQTLAGTKTVYSFKKIPNERFSKAGEGLKIYSPAKEWFIKNRLWTQLDAS